jgi:hypothetical protein
MERFLEGHFYNPTRGNLTLGEAIKELVYYMAEKPEKFYDIIVGCDSSSQEEPQFPVVLVILRQGEGGRFFIKKINYFHDKKFFNWHQRILEEVLLSCEFALYLRENLKNQIPSFLNWEFRYIHADVGENGATKDMIKEVIGLIRGNGFEPKIKPESFVASTVADRYS